MSDVIETTPNVIRIRLRTTAPDVKTAPFAADLVLLNMGQHHTKIHSLENLVATVQRQKKSQIMVRGKHFHFIRPNGGFLIIQLFDANRKDLIDPYRLSLSDSFAGPDNIECEIEITPAKWELADSLYLALGS